MIVGQDHPFGTTLFCDDIRFELANKISFMGVYPQGLLLPHDVVFPVMLPRLGLYVSWHESIESDAKAIQFKAFYAPLNDDPFNEEPGTFLGESMVYKFGSEAPPVVNLVPGAAVKSVASAIVISPLTLPSEGKVRVRAYRDGEVRMLSALTITKVAPPPNDPA